MFSLRFSLAHNRLRAVANGKFRQEHPRRHLLSPFKPVPASDVVLKQIHLACGFVIHYSRITSHSSRHRFAARLNSGVRAHMRSFTASFILGAILTSCTSTPTRPIAVAEPVCFRSTDGLRYNHFLLRLNPDRTYRFNLTGDIGRWSESSGNWTQSQQSVLLTQLSKPDTFDIKFPTTLRILSSGSLGFKYSGAFYSSGGTDLVPSKCEP